MVNRKKWTCVFFVWLSSWVNGLTIDNQLAVIKNDCYERLAIGQRLHQKDVYKVVKAYTVPSCQKECTKEKDICKSFSFGIGVKGNSTCELSLNHVKETADLKPIGTISDSDFDLYIKKLGCTIVIDPNSAHKPAYLTQADFLPTGTQNNLQTYEKPFQSSSEYGGAKPSYLPEKPSYQYPKPSNNYGVEQPDYFNKPSSPNHWAYGSGGPTNDDAYNVQTLVSVSSGLNSYLHPIHEILVGQNPYEYGKPPKNPPPGYEPIKPVYELGYERPNLNRPDYGSIDRPPLKPLVDNRPNRPLDGYEYNPPSKPSYIPSRPLDYGPKPLPDNGYDHRPMQPVLPEPEYNRPLPEPGYHRPINHPISPPNRPPDYINYPPNPYERPTNEYRPETIPQRPSYSRPLPEPQDNYGNRPIKPPIYDNRPQPGYDRPPPVDYGSKPSHPTPINRPQVGPEYDRPLPGNFGLKPSNSYGKPPPTNPLEYDPKPSDYGSKPSQNNGYDRPLGNRPYDDERPMSQLPQNGLNSYDKPIDDRYDRPYDRPHYRPHYRPPPPPYDIRPEYPRPLDRRYDNFDDDKLYHKRPFNDFDRPFNRYASYIPHPDDYRDRPHKNDYDRPHKDRNEYGYLFRPPVDRYDDEPNVVYTVNGQARPVQVSTEYTIIGEKDNGTVPNKQHGYDKETNTTKEDKGTNTGHNGPSITSIITEIKPAGSDADRNP